MYLFCMVQTYWSQNEEELGDSRIPYAGLKDFFETKFENKIVKAFLSDEKRMELENLDGDHDGLVTYGDFLQFLGFWDAVHNQSPNLNHSKSKSNPNLNHSKSKSNPNLNHSKSKSK